MEANTNYWSVFFAQWPADLPRRGIAVTTFNEQIMFATFWTSSNFLLLERQTPDSLGARTIVVPYDQIVAIKIVDVIKPKVFMSAGFAAPPAKTSGGLHSEE